ncbi:hypothetical protein [Phenylobacterium sp.]|uniref:hypothetical protein n=1 Tax=Phenylobacterium sp. TaxID=1871053 RepID=UPI00286D0127|nr:hypothetical protein [Phenylobacterium sp.]
MKLLLAAASYFIVVFVCAFAVGVVRVLAIAPRIGEIGAVLLEAPIVLGLSWIVCGWAVRRFSVPPKSGVRLSMGLIAFLLLMSAEAGLAVVLFGQTLETHVQSYGRAAGALGLSAQLGFAAVPWGQGVLGRRTGRQA